MRFGTKVKIGFQKDLHYSLMRSQGVKIPYFVVWNIIDGEVKHVALDKEFEAMFLGTWEKDARWKVVWNIDLGMLQLVSPESISPIS